MLTNLSRAFIHIEHHTYEIFPSEDTPVHPPKTGSASGYEGGVAVAKRIRKQI
jgi:hypothetical protein